MPAHVEVIVKIPVDCDPVTAQRINQVCRAVMEQFPGIDHGPEHPFRMFLTTLDAYQDRLDGKTPAPTPVEPVEVADSDEPETPDTNEYVEQLVNSYTASWDDREIDRAGLLMQYMVSPAGKYVAAAVENAENPTKFLVEQGATPEQASNLIAVGTAMQLFRI